MRTTLTYRLLKSALTVAFLLTPSYCLLSQSEGLPNQPIELPEFIVTGKSRADIPGGSKRAPNRPPLLSQARLDSLNPLEKIPLPTLPQAPLPDYSQPIMWHPGWVDATLGNYLTPNVDAGYSFDVSGYLIDLTAGLEASSGWVDNSEYFMFDVGAMSTYVAPEKFLFFGGSTTVVDFDLGTKSYNLFADSTVPARSVTSIGGGVETEGRWEGLSYRGLASYSTRSLSTGNLGSTDNVFTGQIGLGQRWNEFDLGADLDLQLRGYRGNGYPYTSLSGNGHFVNSAVRASALVGLQWASSTAGDDRFGVQVGGRLDAFIHSAFTVEAHAKSGLRPIDMQQLLRENPYVSDTLTIDMPYDVVQVGGSVMFHPVLDVTASAGVEFRRTDRDVVWTPSANSTFEPTYLSTTTLTINGDVRWLITSQDVLVADIQIISASVDDNNDKPYVAPVQASAGYERDWTNDLRTVVSLIYVGDRFADLANTITLQSYLDIRVSGMYDITDRIGIQLNAENLLGNQFQLWNGYRERGIFINAGILWKF